MLSSELRLGTRSVLFLRKSCEFSNKPRQCWGALHYINFFIVLLHWFPMVLGRELLFRNKQGREEGQLWVTGSPSVKVFSNMLTSGKLLPDGPTMDQRIFFDFAPSSILVFSLLHMNFSDDGVCLRGSQTYVSWTVHMDIVSKIWPILFQLIGSCRNVLEPEYFHILKMSRSAFASFSSFRALKKGRKRKSKYGYHLNCIVWLTLW